MRYTQIQSSQSEAYWLAIDKFMKHNNPRLAPPPISHLVGITQDNVPYPLALQHELVYEDPVTRAEKAKSIQPLPVIPLTMTDDELKVHFTHDLMALQPSGVVLETATIDRLWDNLQSERKVRLMKMEEDVKN